MLVFLIDKIGVKARFNMKSSIPYFVVLGCLILFVSIYIGISNRISSNIQSDPNYQIYSKTIDHDTITYIVGEKGYSSVLKAKIVITNNKVSTYEILEQNDSYYQKINQSNYIETLIQNQNNLSEVDTVAGATFTSNGLKKMLINTLEDYKNNKDEVVEGTVTIDKDFEVLEHNIVDSIHTYIVSKKGFSSKIKLSISIENNTITNVTVLEINDSYYNKVLEKDYINFLLANQQTLETVDTVSGATITSNALKQALIETLKEYKGDTNE